MAGGDSSVVVRDGGRAVRTLAARSLGGGEDAAVRLVRYLAARRSFVIAFDDRLPELWELSVDPDAAPVFDGLVHDFRMGEALGSQGFLGIRRTRLDAPVVALVFDASQAYVLARFAADSRDGRTRLALLHLDVRRILAHWEIEADPDFDEPLTIQRDGRPFIEMIDRGGGPKILVDLRSAKLSYGD